MHWARTRQLFQFVFFFTQRICSYCRNIFYRGPPNGHLSKIWHSEKKQTELKHCEIFFRKYFLLVINVHDDIVWPIFLQLNMNQTITSKKENSLLYYFDTLSSRVLSILPALPLDWHYLFTQDVINIFDNSNVWLEFFKIFLKILHFFSQCIYNYLSSCNFKNNSINWVLFNALSVSSVYVTAILSRNVTMIQNS